MEIINCPVCGDKNSLQWDSEERRFHGPFGIFVLKIPVATCATCNESWYEDSIVGEILEEMNCLVAKVLNEQDK